jgi:hypothetical protein
MPEKNPTVFISYSHDSPEHADRILVFSNRLREEGIDTILDQYNPHPPEGWPRWMDKHIRGADFVLMVCTEIYYKRVMGEEKPRTGLGVIWEGNLIYDRIFYTTCINTKFIPILLEDGKSEYIPTPCRSVTRYAPDSSDGYEDLYRRLTNQPKGTKPELGKLKALAPQKRQADFFTDRTIH